MFSNVAASRIVPLVASTALSTAVSSPVTNAASCPRGFTRTSSFSPLDFMYFFTSGKSASGTLKKTSTGSIWLMTTRVMSLALTRLPSSTKSRPATAGPVTGETIVQCCNWMFAFSRAASSARTVAASASAFAREFSTSVSGA